MIADLQEDVPFSTKIVALINTVGLDPDNLDMEAFTDKSAWIFYTAWMNFHPELKHARNLKFFSDRASADAINPENLNGNDIDI